MSVAALGIFTALFKYPPRVFARGQLVSAPVAPVPVLVGCLLVAALVGVFAVGRLRGIGSGDRIVLAGIRIAVFAVIAGCLMRPALALTSAVPQRNVLAILLDDSRSMRIRDVDTLRRVAVVQRTFSDSAALIRKLSDKFSLRFFRFSGNAAPISAAAMLQGTGARTDIATSLDAVRQELADAPVAGIVLVSDGADNGVADLPAALRGLNSHDIPVYTVGVGSERFARDISIDRLDVPSTTLSGSGALVTATLGVRGAAGDSTSVTAEADGHIVASTTIALARGRDAVDVPLRLPPLDVGLHRITVHASPIRREVVTENNDASALLRVRPGYERVLYLEGQPRFEFSFMRRAFDDDSAVRVVGLLRSATGKFLRLGVADSLELLGGFPTRREALFRYRALVLGNIEASFFTGDQLRMIADFVDNRGGALLLLGGRSTLAEGGYAGTPIADVLPFTLDVAGRRVADTTLAELKVFPSNEGLRHPAMQLGATLATDTSRWDSLPSVTAVNHLGDLRPGATILLEGQPLPRGTPRPVLAVQHYGRGIAEVLGIQDTWTWKMDPRSPLDDRSFETFWRQLIRWDLDQVPDRVEVSAEPQVAGPGESVTLRARVADSLYVDDNNAQVHADITTPTGATRVIAMPWSLHNDGTYAGQLLADEPGTYQFTVTAVDRGDTTRSAVAGVIADANGADVDHAELRTGLLRRIASETGGRYYPIAELASLPDDVTLTQSGITAHESRDLWDMPAVLLLLVLLLGADWGYRRWRGLA